MVALYWCILLHPPPSLAGPRAQAMLRQYGPCFPSSRHTPQFLISPHLAFKDSPRSNEPLATHAPSVPTTLQLVSTSRPAALCSRPASEPLFSTAYAASPEYVSQLRLAAETSCTVKPLGLGLLCLLKRSRIRIRPNLLASTARRMQTPSSPTRK